MALNPQYLMNWPFRETEHNLIPRDCMLYALSLGIGSNTPYRPENFRYLYESGLTAVTTYPTVLAMQNDEWLLDPQCGINPEMVVHGAHRLTLYKPFPV